MLSDAARSLHREGVFGWDVSFAKAAVGCGLCKSSFEEVAVRKAKVRLVEPLWLLEIYSHLQTGPTCHGHIFFLPLSHLTFSSFLTIS